MKFIYTASLLVLLPLAVWANPYTPSYQDGQVILRIKQNASIQTFESLPGVTEIAPLVEDLNIYLVKMESSVMSAKSSLTYFRSLQDVEWVQLDHVVTNRMTPNDPDFSKQWNLSSKNQAQIHAPEAWDITTGGQDINSNDIVVAIVDGGVEVSHKDLQQNIWFNPNETPGNGIDDDENGYVDDMNGWDVFNDKPQLSEDDHATHIAGIIGARANNGYMLSGINWNVKIMSVDRSGTTSVVVKAYGYVLKNKKLWLESQGKKGANVVATNSSFGVDYGDCQSGSYPAWNDMYNEMGKVGILSAAATANLNIDVDVNGDVPTGCDSPYLIAVTNTTDQDKINSSAAYGKVNVDLGAPGTEVLSTVTKGKSEKYTGTSMATPHVVGAIALMHSGASQEFADFYLQNPSEAAIVIKDTIIKTVDEISDLKNRSVSGGRLNLARAVQQISNYRRN